MGRKQKCRACGEPRKGHVGPAGPQCPKAREEREEAELGEGRERTAKMVAMQRLEVQGSDFWSADGWPEQMGSVRAVASPPRTRDGGSWLGAIRPSMSPPETITTVDNGFPATTSNANSFSWHGSELHRHQEAWPIRACGSITFSGAPAPAYVTSVVTVPAASIAPSGGTMSTWAASAPQCSSSLFRSPWHPTQEVFRPNPPPFPPAGPVPGPNHLGLAYEPVNGHFPHHPNHGYQHPMSVPLNPRQPVFQEPCRFPNVQHASTGHVLDTYTPSMTVNYGRPAYPADSVPHMAAHVPSKSVSSALNGEYVELSDLLDSVNEKNSELKSVVDSEGYMCIKNVKHKKAITSAYKWLEAWGIYEVLMSYQNGFSMFHEMASYRNFVLSLFQRFKAPHVLIYDARHRRKLAACRSVNFSRINYDIYLESFDASALRSGNRCSKCSSVDHELSDCPFAAGGYGDPFLGKKATRSVANEVCRNFQDGKCKFGKKCHRRHVCISCGGAEGKSSCQTCKTKAVSG